MSWKLIVWWDQIETDLQLVRVINMAGPRSTWGTNAPCSSNWNFENK